MFGSSVKGGCDVRSFVRTALSGYELLADPKLNHATLFSEGERETFLNGLLPPSVAMLDEQVLRRLEALRGLDSYLERHARRTIAFRAATNMSLRCRCRGIALLANASDR